MKGVDRLAVSTAFTRGFCRCPLYMLEFTLEFEVVFIVNSLSSRGHGNT